MFRWLNFVKHSALTSCDHSTRMGRIQSKKLQRLLIKYAMPTKTVKATAILRVLPPYHHFSSTPAVGADVSKPSPPFSKEITDVGSMVQWLRLQNKEEEWNNEELKALLSSASFSPSHLLEVIRGLGDSKLGQRFFEWTYKQAFSSSEQKEAIHGPSAYQVMFELASGEQPNPHTRVLELLQKSREQGFSLTTESASLLIHCFGRVGWADECIQVFEEIKPSLRKTTLYNNLLDVLFKLGFTEKALAFVCDLLRPDSECQPNHVTGSIIFSALLKRNPLKVMEEAIVNLVLEMAKHKIYPDAFQFTQWVTRLCRSGNSGKAWDVLHAVEDTGGPVEVPSFNALLTGLGRDKDFKKMNLLLAEMKDRGIQPNVVTFGILINHLCKSRRVDEALQLLNNMIGEGGEEKPDGVSARPDIIIFNTIIDGLCKIGRQEEGLALVDKMKMYHGCSPNTVTYNCLIDGFCKAGAIEKSRELFDQMMEEGVPPNVITLNTIVGGMCRNGRISRALEFFSYMCNKGLKGNVVTYSTLIDAFLRVNNVTKAMELFDEMLRGGNSPDSITYFTLISGLCRAGQVNDASSVALSMQEAGFSLDVISFNDLISGFCRKKKLDKAYEMLKRMEQAGIKPNEVTFNTLIAALSKDGHFSTAHQVLTTMVENGCKPTVVTYGALIHGYCKAGNRDEAMKLFRSMGEAGVTPNDVIYTMLIDSFCKGDELDVALSLMDEMRAQGVLPSVATYNAMFKGLQNRNLLQKAFELMDRMNEDGCNPDYITMEILTEWLSAVGETSRLRKFVQGQHLSV